MRKIDWLLQGCETLFIVRLCVLLLQREEISDDVRVLSNSLTPTQ